MIGELLQDMLKTKKYLICIIFEKPNVFMDFAVTATEIIIESTGTWQSYPNLHNIQTTLN